MNIFNTCRQIIKSGVDYAHYLTGTEPAPDEVKKKDGPGAGGGYKTLDRVEVSPGDDDGPGAGGGYADEVVESTPYDGPGAGGGYDDSVDGDSDGPGAGGGYIDSVDYLPNISGTVTAHWSPSPSTVRVSLSDDGVIDLPAAQIEWLVTPTGSGPIELPVSQSKNPNPQPASKEAQK